MANLLGYAGTTREQHSEKRPSSPELARCCAARDFWRRWERSAFWLDSSTMFHAAAHLFEAPAYQPAQIEERRRYSAAPDCQRIAVIWDMDGTIVNTATQHFKAWQAVFSSRGVAFSREDFRKGFGLRNDDIIRDILGPDAVARRDSRHQPGENGAFPRGGAPRGRRPHARSHRTACRAPRARHPHGGGLVGPSSRISRLSSRC